MQPLAVSGDVGAVERPFPGLVGGQFVVGYLGDPRVPDANLEFVRADSRLGVLDGHVVRLCLTLVGGGLVRFQVDIHLAIARVVGCHRWDTREQCDSQKREQGHPQCRVHTVVSRLPETGKVPCETTVLSLRGVKE